MMEAIRSYLLSVCAVTFLLALVQAILPCGGIRRVCGMAGGLLLLIVVISPIVKLEASDINAVMNKTLQEAVQLETDADDGSQDLIGEIIIQRCREYILDKAIGLGMSIDVEVELKESSGYPIPSKVIITGSYTLQQRTQLEAIIENDMGVPIDCQEWIEM